MSKDLNDDLSDLLSGGFEPRPQPVLPVNFKPVTERVTESCPKCGGSGRFRGWSGAILGECFQCKGTGKLTFKNTAAVRAANRAKADDRKQQQRVDNATAWKDENPAEWAFMLAAAGRWSLMQSFLDGVMKFGSLTEKQHAVVLNAMAKDAARAEQRATRFESAPAIDTVGVDRLKEAFDRAVAYSAEKGLKLSPRITIGGLTISPAKAASKNPGALYVKAGSEYLGKIVDGRFLAVAACTEQQAADVARFVANPAEAAKVYGQTTGTCCVCNATLISKWKHRGIGPICAEKFGW